jgi:polyisoprenoid-binding protein YceI
MMKTTARILGLALLLGAAPALADWALDPDRSHLAFLSIKAEHVGEVHTFREMSGTVDGEGQVRVSLLLDSVDTLIPIRDERMRKFLFETANYREAVLTGKVDPTLLEEMAVGTIEPVVMEGTLSLHGTDQILTLETQAAKLDDGTVMVASTRPVLLDAGEFGLEGGVEKLREIAGLPSISHAVPVTFVLTLLRE